MMKRGFLLVVSTFLLGACALPVPVQLASWAMDGVSLIATHKSVADHGLSLIANEDCAMWRAIEGKNICSGNDASSTVVAVAAAGSPEELANFETAAGTAPANIPANIDDNNPVFESPALPSSYEQVSPEPYSLSYDPSEFTDAWAYIQSSSPPPEIPTMAEKSHAAHVSAAAGSRRPRLTTASLTAVASGDGSKITAWFPIEMTTKIVTKAHSDRTAKAVVKKVKPSKKAPYASVANVYKPGDRTRLPVKSVRKSPDANTLDTKSEFYLVIGSFSKRDRAFSLAAKHILLKPKVAISQMDGKEINRVVIGPFALGDKDAAHLRVRKDGIFDAWAARINPTKWSLLDPLKSDDLAQLTQ